MARTFAWLASSSPALSVSGCRSTRNIGQNLANRVFILPLSFYSYIWLLLTINPVTKLTCALCHIDVVRLISCLWSYSITSLPYWKWATCPHSNWNVRSNRGNRILINGLYVHFLQHWLPQVPRMMWCAHLILNAMVSFVAGACMFQLHDFILYLYRWQWIIKALDWNITWTWNPCTCHSHYRYHCFEVEKENAVSNFNNIILYKGYSCIRNNLCRFAYTTTRCTGDNQQVKFLYILILSEYFTL